MNTWDVVLMRMPSTDGTSAKVRPAVLVSKDNYHNSGEDGIFLLITSNLERKAYYDLLIDSTHREFKQTGLAKSSAIRVDKVMNLRMSLVSRKLGSLGTELKKEVKAKLQELWTI